MNNYNILIIAPSYNDYDKQIRDAFVRNGCDVDLVQYDEYLLINTSLRMRCIKTLLKFKWIRFLRRWINSDILYKKLNSYIYSQIVGRSDKSFDLVLCVKFDGVDMKNIGIIRQIAKKSLLYLYDPIERYKEILDKFAAFDHVATFSRFDSKKYEITHLDLLPISSEKTRKLASLLYYSCFIGELSIHRFTSILKLPLRFLLGSKIILVSSVLNKARFNFGFIEFRGVRLDKKSLDEIYCSSASFLEVMNIDQFDNTPRYHEAKSHGKALICNLKINTIKCDLYFEDVRKIMMNIKIRTPNEFLIYYNELNNLRSIELHYAQNEVNLQDEFVLKLIKIAKGRIA